MPTLNETRDGVHILDLGDGENRFTRAWTAEVGSLLDQVERLHRPAAVVTSATGKFWSNGLDLDELQASPAQADGSLRQVQVLLARFLTSPVFCVAALQGHAFAAGAMLALAHDARVMRADRGFWCLPEIDIDIPFTPGMSALITAKLPARAAHEAMATGRRYGAEDAASHGIVDTVADQDRLLDTAIDIAAAQAGRAGPTLAAIKRGMYAAADRSLREDPAQLSRTVLA